MTDYAIMVMVQLHRQPGEVLTAQALADAAALELPTVSKVLKLLVNTGLVESYRGPAGGYSLITTASDISVAAIIEAIEGPIAMTECSVGEGLCARESDCSLRGNWQRISLAIAQALNSVSLAEMARPEKPLTPALFQMKRDRVSKAGTDMTRTQGSDTKPSRVSQLTQPPTLKLRL